ncbi:hypothetical protein KSP24_23690 [Paenibacillus sp. AK121]|uniref:YunG family protein n=1 Tax=Paenibacillus TaxID=44249 RepID=UPI001C220926|nr:hypothetical protein [Paenibacillus sp. AK121]MBU9709901.1 hypothetical protein [Paenibacillus sp. AK121]MEE4570878.1 hypothetical protein [Paenibacillus polymyxa]
MNANRYLKLEKALFQAWSLESSSKWTANNPAAGQCGVTALVVQDRLGGDILKTWLDSGWHYYNRIGEDIIDFTKSQFLSLPQYQHVQSSREEAFSDTNAEQYAALSRRLGESLNEKV